MTPVLLYLHGFNSSSQSEKAQIMVKWCQKNRPDIKLEVPQLASYPLLAKAQLIALIEEKRKTHQIGIVGSSLGGYLATWLNDKYAIPAVLVNPAVAPYDLLENHLGMQKNPYTNEEYELLPLHMDELKSLEVDTISRPESLWVLQQEGDEVLDYRQAQLKYQRCSFTLEKDGNHAFVDFERFPSKIIAFLNL